MEFVTLECEIGIKDCGGRGRVLGTPAHPPPPYIKGATILVAFFYLEQASAVAQSSASWRYACGVDKLRKAGI
jgi:hypothetical protein